MDITCPHCRQTLEGETVNPGDAVVCPACNREFSVPKLVAVGPELISNQRKISSSQELRKNQSGFQRTRIITLAILVVGLILGISKTKPTTLDASFKAVADEEKRLATVGMTSEELELFNRFYKPRKIRPSWLTRNILLPLWHGKSNAAESCRKDYADAAAKAKANVEKEIARRLALKRNTILHHNLMEKVAGFDSSKTYSSEVKPAQPSAPANPSPADNANYEPVKRLLYGASDY